MTATPSDGPEAASGSPRAGPGVWLAGASAATTVVATCAVALLVRVLELVQQRAGNPLFELAILDDRNYLDLARELASGSGGATSWFLAPLYPFVLSLAGSVGGFSLATASVLSLLCGVGTTALVALGARRLHGPVAGWIGGLLQALAGTFVFHDILPGQEPLLCLLHAAGFLLTLRLLERPAAAPAVALGLLAGVAMLGRATSIALPLAALVVLLPRCDGRGPRLRLAGALVAGLALVLVPAALRNLSVVGDLTPFPWSGGVNLYMANGPDARAGTTFGARELGGSPQEMRLRAVSVAERAEGRELRPSEVSSYWTRRTLESLDGPGDAAAHLAKKALLFWSARPFGNNHSVDVERRFSVWLSLVPVGGWWLLALGAGGFVLIRRGRPGADVAALTILLAWGALVVFFPVSRYRLPVLPLAVVLAAGGIAELMTTGLRARAAVLRAGGVTALAAIAAFVPVWTGLQEWGGASSYANVASALRERGDLAEAESIVRDGLERAPEDGSLLLELARVRVELSLARKDPSLLADVLEALQKAEHDPSTHYPAGAVGVLVLVLRADLPSAHRALGYLDEHRDDLDTATRVEVEAYRALVFHASGDPARARAHLDRIDAEAPGAPATRLVRKLVGP